MNKINNPEIPISHQNEWISKNKFEDLIQSKNMFMPFGWSVKDYGVDGLVEITKQDFNTDSLFPEGKSFQVQLKSTKSLNLNKHFVSFSIETKKITQWYNSNLPFMFAIYDVVSNVFYYLWIDEILINSLDTTNSNWLNQKTITLKIPKENILNNCSIEEIREYIIDWKISPKLLIEPGTFFKFKDKCSENVLEFDRINKVFDFESAKNTIENITNQIEQAIYKITITGPSRVGKSTLINALLSSNDISPTGIFQTTSVPIQILPDKNNFVMIYFKNKKALKEKFSKQVIENYASQEYNDDNIKEVSLISIHISNKHLEKGVSFYDVPGLDDPDENIYQYAWNTALKSNAILYLIDASSFAHGGFIFRKEYKNQILELGKSLDKIFLVFTKINVLQPEQLHQFKERIKKDIEKLKLNEIIEDNIFYISATESLDIRLNNKQGNDTVQFLEDKLWIYLLKNNKLGLANLCSTNNELVKAIVNFENILNTRLLDNATREELEEEIKKVKSKFPIIKKIFNESKENIIKNINHSIENHKNDILNQLHDNLNLMKLDTPLPNKIYFTNFLINGCNKVIESNNIELEKQIHLFKENINSWIENNLKQVRQIIDSNSDQKLVDLSDIEKIEIPSFDFSNSLGVGVVTGLIGLLFAPASAFFLGIGAFITNLFVSESDQRNKSINKIMHNTRKHYYPIFERMKALYVEVINEKSNKIDNYTNNQINTFINDIEIQINKLNTSISDEEKINYQNTFNNLSLLKQNIIDLNNGIKYYI